VRPPRDHRVARMRAALSENLHSSQLHWTGKGYQEARRRLYNVGLDFTPHMVVTVESTSDVRATVLAALDHGLTVSVLGGGNDWSGRSVRGDVVIDLIRMQRVQIRGDVAEVQGGATLAQLADAAESHGLAAATGTMGRVGIGGLTLGGGYGPLTGRLGLAADNLIGAEVVLADGRVVQTDLTSEPDLFWALRGGGGNFGVVTAMRIRLHPISSVSAGTIAFPMDQAPDVLARYDELVARFPEELTETVGFLQTPDGSMVLVILHAWCGDETADTRIRDMVAGLGDPLLVQVHRQSPAQMLREADRLAVVGAKLLCRTVTVPALSTETAHILTTAMKERPSALSWIGMHPFHGAPERIPVESTAFGIRQRHVMIGFYALWRDDDDAQNRAWADAAEKAMSPYTLHSAYPNYFGEDRPEQAAVAYGPNASRLLRVKATYDPNNVFRAISLPHNESHADT
jgi:FAD/FMN-containing dehydrogenase